MSNKRLTVPPMKGNPQRKRPEFRKFADIPTRERDWKTPYRPLADPSEPFSETSFAEPIPSISQKRGEENSTGKRNQQAPRLKVTIQRPDLLDALSENLGLNRSAVLNVALSVLAEREGLT